MLTYDSSVIFDHLYSRSCVFGFIKVVPLLACVKLDLYCTRTINICSFFFTKSIKLF